MASTVVRLNDRWAEGITIVICQPCRGWGVIGPYCRDARLDTTCPQCNGSGRTTNLSEGTE